jgi:hypothetical protein
MKNKIVIFVPLVFLNCVIAGVGLSQHCAI